MRKPVLKAYFGSIFFEFMLQDRIADAVIILPNFPGRSDYNPLLSLFYERGYHVFLPRYRGSYQSSGNFLAKNPVDDLIAFVKQLDKGKVKNLWDMQTLQFKIHNKILIATNFSTSIACGLAAKHPGFNHLILASPIWDFMKHNEKGDERNMRQMGEFAKRAYENVYRIEFKDLIEKLEKFKELKPEYYLSALINFPILIFHDPNDTYVAFRHTKEMLGKLNKATYIEHYLGHGLSDSLLNAYWKEIDKFIKVNYL